MLCQALQRKWVWFCSEIQLKPNRLKGHHSYTLWPEWPCITDRIKTIFHIFKACSWPLETPLVLEEKISEGSSHCFFFSFSNHSLIMVNAQVRDWRSVLRFTFFINVLIIYLFTKNHFLQLFLILKQILFCNTKHKTCKSKLKILGYNLL